MLYYFMSIFLVVLPGFFWSLLKSFTATVLWEEQLVKSENRDSPTGANETRQPKAGFGPVALVSESKLDLIYSPQNLVQTLCQLLRWCQLW